MIKPLWQPPPQKESERPTATCYHPNSWIPSYRIAKPHNPNETIQNYAKLKEQTWNFSLCTASYESPANIVFTCQVIIHKYSHSSQISQLWCSVVIALELSKASKKKNAHQLYPPHWSIEQGIKTRYSPTISSSPAMGWLGWAGLGSRREQ